MKKKKEREKKKIKNFPPVSNLVSHMGIGKQFWNKSNQRKFFKNKTAAFQKYWVHMVESIGYTSQTNTQGMWEPVRTEESKKAWQLSLMCVPVLGPRMKKECKF